MLVDASREVPQALDDGRMTVLRQNGLHFFFRLEFPTCGGAMAAFDFVGARVAEGCLIASTDVEFSVWVKASTPAETIGQCWEIARQMQARRFAGDVHRYLAPGGKDGI